MCTAIFTEIRSALLISAHLIQTLGMLQYLTRSGRRFSSPRPQTTTQTQFWKQLKTELFVKLKNVFVTFYQNN